MLLQMLLPHQAIEWGPQEPQQLPLLHSQAIGKSADEDSLVARDVAGTEPL